MKKLENNGSSVIIEVTRILSDNQVKQLQEPIRRLSELSSYGFEIPV
jgi:hypothetical protein